MTSHDVVYHARRIFRTKRVGHTGTLDPDATGVLVLCIGQATRLAEYLSAAKKNYVAEFVFGIETTTLDASGEILKKTDASSMTSESLLELLPAFRGNIVQVPPMVSAKHHQGRRLYELAREGVVVEREPREITIYSLELLEFQSGIHPIATLDITCSSGTYIRSIADDLGRAAGLGGMMQSLRRIWVGTSNDYCLHLRQAYTIDTLQALAKDNLQHQALLPLTEGFRHWKQYPLTPDLLLRLRNGQSVQIPPRDAEDCAKLALVLSENGMVFAVVRQDSQTLYPVKVLASNDL